MIKQPEDMTREELIASVKDLRGVLLKMHERFLSGLIMEVETGELKLLDLDQEVLARLKKVLGIGSPSYP